MSAHAHAAIGRADGSGAMFDDIAGRYDLLNSLMSFGQHGRWRRRLVAALELPAAPVVLDVATGTADVAIDLARARPQARVIGLDPSHGMLQVGEAKVARAGLGERIQLVVARAEQLPFGDGHFDACSIAFGIRNVPDRAAALRELYRVTKAGGRIGVLELTRPSGGLLALAARAWVRLALPLLGLITAFAGAYRYLPRSIAAFPAPPAFVAELCAAGFSEVRCVRLQLGAVHLFVARR